MADLKKLAEELSKLTVLEAAELVKSLEEEWGVSAAAPVAVAAAGPGAAAAEAEEEKTEFDVVLKDTGPKKIDVIKVIRQLTSLGLVDAKTMAETAGSKVLTQRLAKKPQMMPKRNSKLLVLQLNLHSYLIIRKKTAEISAVFLFFHHPHCHHTLLIHHIQLSPIRRKQKVHNTKC